MADENVTTAPDATTEAPAAEVPKAEGSILETGGVEAKPAVDDAEAPPKDWRETMAERAPEADREAARKVLARLSDESAVIKKLIEQEKLIRSGKHKAPLGEGASEEDIAEFRKANGIPEKPEGYADALEGFVIGDEDKADIDAFFEKMHGLNADPKAVRASVEAFYQMQEAKAAREVEADREFRQQSIDQLREAMGNDYRANMNDLKAWLGSQEGMLEAFAAARGPDGRMLGDNPAVINFLVSQMREINPLSTVVGVGAGGAQGLKDEIAKYNAMMGDPKSPYWTDPAIQERYRKLLEAEERQNARAA